MSFYGEFPHNIPATSHASMFIQWKGTDLCMDFTCACGTDGHADGYGASYVQCPSCETIYELGTQVIARRVSAEDTRTPPLRLVRDEDKP